MSKSKLPENINISTSLVANLIDEYCFNEKYREILKRRYLDEHTFDSIADEFDMSSRQIQNIVYKHGKKLLDRINNIIIEDYYKKKDSN